MKRFSLVSLILSSLVLLGSGCKKDESMAREQTVESANKASETAEDKQEDVNKQAGELAEAQKDMAKAVTEQGKEVAEQAKDLQNAAAEARRTDAWFKGTREDVAREARATLDAMDRHIAELSDRLATRTDLSAEARHDADVALTAMRDARAKAALQLDKIQTATASSWDNLRGDARAAFESLDDAYDKAKDKIL